MNHSAIVQANNWFLKPHSEILSLTTFLVLISVIVSEKERDPMNLFNKSFPVFYDRSVEMRVKWYSPKVF